MTRASWGKIQGKLNQGARITTILTALLFALLHAMNSYAEVSCREQAKALYDRLAVYIRLDDPRLLDMESKICAGQYIAAAQVATSDPAFANDTLRAFFTPISNRDGAANVNLNDFTMTGIGLVWQDRPYTEVVTANVVYSIDNTKLTLNASATSDYGLQNNDVKITNDRCLC